MSELCPNCGAALWVDRVDGSSHCPNCDWCNGCAPPQLHPVNENVLIDFYDRRPLYGVSSSAIDRDEKELKQ